MTRSAGILCTLSSVNVAKLAEINNRIDCIFPRTVMLPSVQWVMAGLGLISLYPLPLSVKSIKKIVSLMNFIVPELKWREKILSGVGLHPPP